MEIDEAGCWTVDIVSSAIIYLIKRIRYARM